MALLTDRQRQQVEDTIRDHHLAFCAEVLGSDSIPKADYDRLVRAGKIRPSVALEVDAATSAIVLGTLVGRSEEKTIEAMSPATFAAALPTLAPKLSSEELAAVDHARTKIGEHIKGLGNKLDAKTGHLIVDGDEKLRRKRLTTIRAEVSRGLEERKTVGEIATRLKDAMRDMKRDWLQIAHTEVHNAVEDGKATALIGGLPPGSDPLVYKRPRPDACPFCKLLYLQKDGHTPRIFHISELVAAGSNVGRKARRPKLRGPMATEWRATIGAMHPWCQCTLFHMPEGFIFDRVGNLTYVGIRKAAVLVESLDRALLAHACTH